MTSSRMLEFAQRGAGHRYQELKDEIASLMKAFPHLRARARKAVHVGLAVEKTKEPFHSAADVRRRRRPMSAARKKAISERMKTYWAARRQAK